MSNFPISPQSGDMQKWYCPIGIFLQCQLKCRSVNVQLSHSPLLEGSHPQCSAGHLTCFHRALSKEAAFCFPSLCTLTHTGLRIILLYCYFKFTAHCTQEMPAKFVTLHVFKSQHQATTAQSVESTLAGVRFFQIFYLEPFSLGHRYFKSGIIHTWKQNLGNQTPQETEMYNLELPTLVPIYIYIYIYS